MNKPPIGRKLRQLHRGNAWIIVFLAVSGLLLYWPPMRALLGGGRFWLKQLHIAAGLVSLLLLMKYAPLLRKHWRQLVSRPGQRANLLVVLLLLAGWIVSGLVLWRFRSFPPAWNSLALFIHDAFTWVGVPYAIYHSISRSRWLKAAGRSRASENAGQRMRNAAGLAGQGAIDSAGAETTLPASAEAASTALKVGASYPSAGQLLTDNPDTRDVGVYEPSTGRFFRSLSRRTFLRLGFGTLLAAVVGPLFYRWLSSAAGNGGSTTDSLLEETLSSATASVLEPSPEPHSLPPIGGGAKGRFRIYTVTDMPEFQPDAWSFKIDGLVEHPKGWDWPGFLQLPRDVQVSDFHCVTGWSVTSCTWEGIPLRRLLAEAGVKLNAKTVKFYSGDGIYTDSLTLDQARMNDVMVVCLLDGKPIPKELGGPVRLVVPQMYTYKSVKWLNRIELLDTDHTGYWEQRGYSKNAWVKA